jgi:hypothetical protein
MSVLVAEPFMLEQGSLIVAKVGAANLLGTSDYSDENSVGAVIQTVPHTPALGPIRGEQTSTI